MVFRRRNKISWGRWLIEGVYPRAGWRRAISYIGHRLRRLPDPPHKIARGIGVGVFVSFTPFFGFHFLVAVALAWIFRSNMLAALLATFFGNPISFPFIATLSVGLGQWILGGAMDLSAQQPISSLLAHASWDLWQNILAIFTDRQANWARPGLFFSSVFLPYLVGGCLLGLIGGTTAYFLSQPLITAYQKRRKGRLLEKWKERRANAAKVADDED